MTLEFSHGDQIQSLTLDQNSPDIANPSAPYSIDYEFKATSSEVAITAVQHAGNRPWFWYGLSNEVAQQTGNTEVAIGPQTHYFRTQFSYDGDTLASHEVRLQLHVDDGAVVYLNGTEIHRDNMAVGLVGFETSAVQEVTRTQRRDPVTLPGDTLKQHTCWDLER